MYLNKLYKFTLPVNKLKKDILYFEIGNKSVRKTLKRKHTVKRRKTVKRKRSRK